MTRQQRRRRREAIRSGVAMAVMLTLCLSAEALADLAVPRTVYAPEDKPLVVILPPKGASWTREAEEITRPDVPLDADLQAALYAACAAQDVPVALALGLIEVESRFDPQAVSPSGCYGLCQLNPRYFPGGLDPADNLAAGVAYLGELLRRYDGAVDQALVAYNQGAYKGTVTRYAKDVLEASGRWEEQ